MHSQGKPLLWRPTPSCAAISLGLLNARFFVAPWPHKKEKWKAKDYPWGNIKFSITDSITNANAYVQLLTTHLLFALRNWPRTFVLHIGPHCEDMHLRNLTAIAQIIAVYRPSHGMPRCGLYRCLIVAVYRPVSIRYRLLQFMPFDWNENRS